MTWTVGPDLVALPTYSEGWPCGQPLHIPARWKLRALDFLVALPLHVLLYGSYPTPTEALDQIPHA